MRVDLNADVGESFGADIIGGSATEFRAFLAAERNKWGNMIRKQGIKAN